MSGFCRWTAELQPPQRPAPFFPEVHNEISWSWHTPHSAQGPVKGTPLLSSVDRAYHWGYARPQTVKEAIASHLYPLTRGWKHQFQQHYRHTSEAFPENAGVDGGGLSLLPPRPAIYETTSAVAKSLGTTQHVAERPDAVLVTRYCVAYTVDDSSSSPLLFLLYVLERYVLICTDNTAVLVYIND
ncbi:hypothetical protein DPX16_9316 [Anabarilius grahami]|uniref:Uncharacterized protein n=1 Tax=Anabarilius grahami TaxID=495550 RepID=A0A3N0Y6A8_ANAGA|nr:hypothetical protein DPX16_9316 [Anabarilius grahami]